MDKLVKNINVESIRKLLTPRQLKEILPNTASNISFVETSRQTIKNILSGLDKRKIVVVGPCSIHDIEMAKEYGRFLKDMQAQYHEKIFIIMRVYFEKPRTTVGWKGLINDPDLNNTFNINKGLKLARELLLYLNQINVPCGYEILDTFTPQYIDELISWGAIGARTTESQIHRQLVSGLSMPVGFKNNSSGEIDIARDAIISASYPHCFYGINDEGQASIVKTKGNANTHIILRGSKYGTNYDIQSINRVIEEFEKKNIKPNIMIDCSHGNSGKDYRNQHYGFMYTVTNIKNGKDLIMGFMLESNLVEGNQKLVFGERDDLDWGVSITDSCIGLDETNKLLKTLYDVL